MATSRLALASRVARRALVAAALASAGCGHGADAADAGVDGAGGQPSSRELVIVHAGYDASPSVEGGAPNATTARTQSPVAPVVDRVGGWIACGSGWCPSTMSCSAASVCVASPVPGASCPSITAACAGDPSRCCLLGSRCEASGCVVDAVASGTCPQAWLQQCDGFCCPASSSGVSCGASGSGECTVLGADVAQKGAACGGGFCAVGPSCVSGSCQLQPQPLYPSVAGPACGAGVCAMPGASCTGDGRCCDRVVCGAECCGSGVNACVGSGGSTCACARGEACGDRCCAWGETCVAGVCTPRCGGAYPTVCGDDCCATGVACGVDPTSPSGHACQCPADHPVACGDDCCLPSAACLAANDCGCPAGSATCGDWCCAPGERCVAGACVAGGASSGACASTSDCAGFGARNCGGATQTRCADDALCHCCVQLCSGGACACTGCSGACAGPPQTTCAADGTCLFSLGGTTDQ